MKSKWIIASILILVLILLCGASLYATWTGVRMVQDSGVRFRLGTNTTSAKASEEKVLTVSGPANLSVENDFGDISVYNGADGQVSVKAEKTAWGSSEADAQAALKDLKVVYEQNGNSIKISVQQPVEVDTLHFGPSGGSVKFTITVPKETAVTLNSSNGDLSLMGTAGGADLKTDFGALSLTDVSGIVQGKSNNGTITARKITSEGNVTLSSQFGSINLDTVQGSDVTVSSNNGPLDLNDVKTGGLLKATSEFGDIHIVDSHAGTTDIHSNNGTVKLEKLDVDTKITVDSDFGNLTLIQVNASAYDLDTKNGKISLDGAKGPIRAHSDFGEVEVLNAQNATIDLSSNNGSVTFSGSLAAGPHSVTSEFGNIKLILPAGMALNVDLQTEFGKISSDFDVTVNGNSLDEKHWKGKINGGGQQLTVKNNNGNITFLISK